LLISIFLYFPNAMENTMDEVINEALAPSTNFISSIIFYSVRINGVEIPIILLWLLSAGLFFTIYLGFINFTRFHHALQIVSGKYRHDNKPGEVSPFQALSAALSGTLGLGNISGVAIAITAGGPGATFWMIMAGLIGMSSKFAECTLGVKYRNKNPDGSVSGGPMYYLQKGFSLRGYKRIGKGLGIFFALMCIGGAIGGGNMFQSNQAARQILHTFSGPGSWLPDNVWMIGLATAIIVGTVIIGGIRSIAKVSEILVPCMCTVYILAGIIVILFHWQNLPDAFWLIIEKAFEPDAVKGGMLGTMLQGFQRASFSNEAGIGSASIAHAAVKTNEPVSEGMVGLLEPFIDTVVVCTVTAIVIVITGTYESSVTNGVEVTSIAFQKVMPWFPYVLTVAVFCFAFATMISWSYYGAKSWAYLFGEGKWTGLTFQFIYCVFTMLGASMEVKNVVLFSDAMIFAMSIPNIIGLYFFAYEVKKDLKIYWANRPLINK
jgi:AGCS family alanine or glycine:cation symporter